MNCKKDVVLNGTMTNEEYRCEIQNIFSEIEENYILRWFYIFIITKLKGSK